MTALSVRFFIKSSLLPIAAAACALAGCDSGWVKYSHPAHDFVVEHPQGWTIERKQNATIFSDTTRPGSTLVVTSVRKLAHGLRRNAKSVRDGLIDQYTAMGNCQIHKNSNQDSLGEASYELEVSIMLNNRTYRRVQRIIDFSEELLLVVDCNARNAKPNTKTCNRFFYSLEAADA